MDRIYSTAHGEGMQERRQSLLEMKQIAHQAIANLNNIAVGASAEEMSIIRNLIELANNNIKFADISLSCYPEQQVLPANAA